MDAGLFELSVVGTEEQLKKMIQSARVQEMFGLSSDTDVKKVTYPIEGKRNFQWGSNGACSVSVVEDMVQELADKMPELEIAQAVSLSDFDLEGQWTITYYPANRREWTISFPARDTNENGQPLGSYDTSGDWQGLQGDYPECPWVLIVKWEDICQGIRKEDSFISRFGVWECLDFKKILVYGAKKGCNPALTEDILNYWIEELLKDEDEDNWLNPPEHADELKEEAYALVQDYWNQWGNYIAGSEDRLYRMLHVNNNDPEWMAERVGRFYPTEFDDRFAGKTFVLTGEPDGYGREGTEELIQKFGGVVRGAVSGKTNYLIVGEDPGKRKLEKARELGTTILNTDEFEKMLSPKE